MRLWVAGDAFTDQSTIGVVEGVEVDDASCVEEGLLIWWLLGRRDWVSFYNGSGRLRAIPKS